MALGDLVKSTLGPKGMNKILQSGSSGDVNVTNDGATILKAIQLDNAAAKILVNISKVQDDEVGDGTTSVCVLASELLREAEKLIMARIHPQTIVEGYRIASAAALKALEKAATDNRCVSYQFLYLVLMADCVISAQIPLNSAPIYSTLHGQHYRRKSCPKTRNILPILRSMLFSDFRDQQIWSTFRSSNVWGEN